jgi:hypothetical protein
VNRLRAGSLLLILLLTSARTARADWYLTPFVGVTFASHASLGSDSSNREGAIEDKKLSYAGSGLWLGGGILGLEGEFSLVPGFFQDPSISLYSTSHVWTLAGNVVVAAPLRLTGLSLRPYASGGPALIRARAEGLDSAFGFDRHRPGLNVGGGVIGLLSEKRGVRFDLRYFRTIERLNSVSESTITVDYWRMNFGVILKF